MLRSLLLISSTQLAQQNSDSLVSLAVLLPSCCLRSSMTFEYGIPSHRIPYRNRSCSSYHCFWVSQFVICISKFSFNSIPWQLPAGSWSSSLCFLVSCAVSHFPTSVTNAKCCLFIPLKCSWLLPSLIIESDKNAQINYEFNGGQIAIVLRKIHYCHIFQKVSN